jgi:hypothetical protein
MPNYDSNNSANFKLAAKVRPFSETAGPEFSENALTLAHNSKFT